MSLTLTVTQLTATTVRLDWSSTGPDPAAGFGISSRVDPGVLAPIATVDGLLRLFVDAPAAVAGDLVEYEVEDLDTTTSIVQSIVWQDLDNVEYPPVDPYATDLRYTTLDDLKGRLRIPVANTDFDARATQAGIAAEYGLDVELGRSFVPETGIPIAVVEAATNVGIAVYKAGDAPTGVAGSDDFIGSLDVSEVVRGEMNRNPLLKGFKVSFGIA